ncbi:flavodoxin FldA [Roseofilum casamattae]|uniref:Flavodoxin n=1 Tax=Roseofilum casamattae BLCC-M143 TaxID=3022442 RepID=A0ABT7BZS4_9CYAN|nr:flavodoxin FldA [Roseofilum casamattae]MDJ1183936.1 flavodoxin FldA [Roseofilum casamattae BLCC-M143]
MAKIGLFYGTQTGKTESAAEEIQKEFGGDDVVAIKDIADSVPSDLDSYDCLIIGSPTWNVGDLVDSWDSFYNDELGSMNFSGKKVAYFGTGDQFGYADNFQDAIGMLEEKISSLGGQTVGYWPRGTEDDYDFNESKALRGDKFVGLALDDDNQEEKSEERIKAWVAQLKGEFGV